MQACKCANGGVSLKLETVTPVSYYCPQTPPQHFLNSTDPEFREPVPKGPTKAWLDVWSRSGSADSTFLVRSNTCHRRAGVTIPAWYSLWRWRHMVPHSKHMQCVQLTRLYANTFLRFYQIRTDTPDVLWPITPFSLTLSVFYKVETSDVLSSMLLLTKAFYRAKALKVFIRLECISAPHDARLMAETR